MSVIRIETERLIMRPIARTDADDFLEYHSQEEIVRYIPWTVRDLPAVHEWLDRMLAQVKSSLESDGDFILLSWELKSTGKVIGQSNLKLDSAEDKRAEFGYVTHQDFQGQGYAYEASRALLDWAFSTFDIHRIIANIDADNPVSAKLAEKLGMRLEGHFIESEWFKEHWCSMWLYAKLASEHTYR
jgi:aminoglycoside 6'-N-acetyltransferase